MHIILPSSAIANHGQDYYATYYAAEIINTLTNGLFIYLAYQGVKSCRKHGHDTVFQVAYFGYFLVGFGSLMFHATLKCELYLHCPSASPLLIKSSRSMAAG